MAGLITKPWGSEQLLEHNKQYVLKKLWMKKGCRCSKQKHLKKMETVYVLLGVLRVDFAIGDPLIIRQGDYLTLPPNTVHRMTAEEGDCYYLEASTPELDDVVRLEDDHGRVCVPSGDTVCGDGQPDEGADSACQQGPPRGSE